MRRICVALATIIPLLVEASKLTHYADSSAFVKYPLNNSTNGLVDPLPRQLDESAIPGGHHPSNQTRRITYDVVCSMAGTVDAFVRRHVAASLFGTQEAAGYMLGTNYVTGAQYDTTNLINSKLFFDNVMGWTNSFSLKSLDYNEQPTTNHVTRRMFADKYLKPIQNILSVANYDMWAWGNIPGMIRQEGMSVWMNNPPQVQDRKGNQGRKFTSDYEAYYQSAVIGWGSSYAERNTFKGVGNSTWRSDPSDLVSDWGCFYANIPKIFEDPNVIYDTDDGWRDKNLYNSVLNSAPGNYAFYPISNLRYVSYAKFGGHLSGYYYNEMSQNYLNESYPGRRGFELMSDTCGHAISNITQVNTRRIVYEPFEHCNAFLGLLDTIYLSQSAMPLWRYDRTNENVSLTIQCDINSGSSIVEIECDQATGRWYPKTPLTLHAENYIEAVTNTYSYDSTTENRMSGFVFDSATFYGFADKTNATFSGRNQLGSIPDCDGWVYAINSPANERWVRIVVYDDSGIRKIGEWDYTDALPDGVILNGNCRFTTSGTMIRSQRKNLDYRLMSQTNSWPCCHPLNVTPVSLDDVDEICYTGFAGLHVITSSYVDIEWDDPCYSTFNLTATDGLKTAREVDYAADEHESKFKDKMNELTNRYEGFDDNTRSIEHLKSCWRNPNQSGLVERMKNLIASNGLIRTWGSKAASGLHFRERAGESEVSEDGINWVSWPRDPIIHESIPECMRIYWYYRIAESVDESDLRLKQSCIVKGATTSIGAVKYDFKTMKRED